MTLSPAPAATLLRDRVDHWARVRPDAIAVTFGEQTFTWAQWRQRILRLSGALRDAGVRPGDRLAVLDLNHLATVELTMAGSALGAATAMVNFRLSPDQVRYILEDSRPVVPEVYITRQTSSGFTLSPSSGCPAARNGSYSSFPPITIRRETRVSASRVVTTSANCAPWKRITGRESSRI